MKTTLNLHLTYEHRSPDSKSGTIYLVRCACNTRPRNQARVSTTRGRGRSCLRSLARARHGHRTSDRQDLIEPSHHSKIQFSCRFFTDAAGARVEPSRSHR
eukprot:1195600-Prorocentrum_minimum.AAC.6